MVSNSIGSIERGNIKITVIATNTASSTMLNEDKFKGKVIQPGPMGSKLLAEHGLAFLFEISTGEEKETFLLDSGGPKGTIVENLESLGINLDEISKLILSHGHVDHFGGFIKLLPKLREGCEIIITPEAYQETVILVPEIGTYYSPEELSENYRTLAKKKGTKFSLPLPPLRKPLVEKLINENNLKLVEPTEPLMLGEGIMTSGPIELFDGSEPTKGFYLKKSRKEFVKNTFRDENSIYLNVKDKGLVVISGCGHAGIVNTIKHGQKLTGVENIYAVIGGFHKEWEKSEDIEKAVKNIEDFNPEITCGMHCTGFEFNKIMSRHPSHTLGIVGTEFHL